MASQTSITESGKEWDPWAGPHEAVAKAEPESSPEGR